MGVNRSYCFAYQQTSSILSNPPVMLEEEPVNRVGKVIAYLLVAFAVLGFVLAVI